MKLEDKPDGSFLVRDSSDDRYILSLSFRSQGVTHHTRIEHYKGEFRLVRLSEEARCGSTRSYKIGSIISWLDGVKDAQTRLYFYKLS